MQHIIDTERIFNYRALRIARKDTENLSCFDQDDFNDNAKANNRKLSDIINEFLSVRNATISLFESFDSDQLKQKGLASNSEISVRAIGYIMAGHCQHHMTIFKERYL